MGKGAIKIEPRKKDAIDYTIPFFGVLLLIFFSLHLAVSYDNVKNNPEFRSDGREKFNARAFMSDIGDRLQNNLTEIEITESTPVFVGGAGIVCLFAYFYMAASKKKRIDGKEYGTAEWANIKSISRLFACNLVKPEIKAVKKKRGIRKGTKKKLIAAVKEKYADADMLFTATERICLYNYELNNNTLIIGGSGSGKTRGFVLPNILQAHSSYVITDPKSEIVEKTGNFLKKQGYKIRVLNLDEKVLSNGYNPFYYIHRERGGWEERILSLIETIIINTDGGEKKSGTDPFWDKAERLFLQAVFFAVAEAFPAYQSNMNTAVELIRWLKIEEDGDNHTSDLDIFFELFAKTYGEDHIGVQQYQEFRHKASGRTAKSIVISAVARLAPFKVKEIRRIFSYDDMYLDMVGEEKTAVFIIVPPVDKTYNFIAGMCLTQLFQELNYCALNKHKHNGQRLPVPCRFILDEFANTATIPNFISILSYARSLGIGIVTILQSLEQIKNMYKDEWGVIIDNSNTLLYLGRVTHMDTLEYLSKLLGKGTYDKQTTSRTTGGKGSSSVNRDKFGRELLDPSEIRKMKNDRCLLFVGGQNPFYSRKYNYIRHKNYRYTSDASRDNIFTYKPLIPPVVARMQGHAGDLEDINTNSTEEPYLPPIIEETEIKAEYGQDKINKYAYANETDTIDYDGDELLVLDEDDGEKPINKPVSDVPHESEPKNGNQENSSTAADVDVDHDGGQNEAFDLFSDFIGEKSVMIHTERNDTDDILSAVIALDTNEKNIAETGVDFIKTEIKNPDSIKFDDYELDDGEPSIAEHYNFDEKYELRDINLVLSGTQTLIKNMNIEGFSEQLNEIDLSKFPDAR